MQEFNFDQDPEDMSPEDARETLADFMAQHEDNVEDYKKLQDELSEFTELVDSADDIAEIKGKHEGIKSHFAQGLSEHMEEKTGMSFTDGEIAENFDLTRIIELNEERKEFAREEEGEEVPDEPTFDDKPQKSEFKDGTDAEKQAQKDMESILGGF